MAIGGNNEFNITNVFKADGLLKVELDEAKKRIEELESDLRSANAEWEYMSGQVDSLTDQLEELRVNSGVTALEEQISKLKASTSAASEEFLGFLRSVSLVKENPITGRYDKIINIQDKGKIVGWLNDVRNGALTVNQAIANVKANFASLVTEAAGSGESIDSQMVKGILSGINQISSMLTEVHTKISSIETNGIRAIGDIGGGDIPGILDHIQQAIAGMSEEARAAYQPITQLVAALNEYASIDQMKIIGVSQTFRNMADVGEGSFSVKKIDNIISLVNRLKSAVGGGLPTIQIDLTKFNELHVRKASLNNLATYLPIISKDVDVASLERLQKINLTNFNNVTVSKSSLNAIADLANYRDSLDLFKDSVNQVIASINILNQSIATLNNKNSGNKSPESDLIKRMMDASTMAHNLLNGNINSGDMTTYKEFISTLQTIDKWLDDCGRDASKLPNAMGVSMDDASDKVNMLIERLSALKNEMVVDEKSGTFTRRGVNDTLNQMLSLRNKSGDYSGTAEFQNLESQIRLFGDAIQYCKTQGVSLNDAFKHFGTDGIIAIDAAKTSMSALKLKVTETAQSITDTKMLDKARVKSDWEIRGLEERDINKLYRQVRLMADSSTEFQTIKKKYNALINEQNIWEASGKDYTAAEIQNITAMREELKTLMEQYINDTKELNKLLNADDAKARAQQSAKWKLGGIESKDIDSLYSKVEKLPKEKAKLDEINKKYAELINTQKLWEENGKDLTAPEVQSITKLREELKTLMEQYIKTEEAKRNSASADLTAKWQSQGITESNIKSLFGKAEKNQELFDSFDELKEKYRELIVLQEQWKKDGANPNDKRVEQITRERKAIKELIEAKLNESNVNKSSQADMTKRQAALKQSQVLLQKLTKAERDWSAAKNGKSSSSYAAIRADRQELERLIDEYRAGKIPLENFKHRLQQLDTEFVKNSNDIKSSGEATKSWGERIRGLADKFGTWFSITRVIMAAVRATREMISVSIELDEAMTQMKIVTRASSEEMERFGRSAVNAAKDTATSIADITSSATTYARLGYDTDTSTSLAKYTAMLQNVGNIDVQDAQDAITSIIKAFDVDVDKIEEIMDKLVVTGNNFPISVSQIAEGMTNASSTMKASGNTFEQTVALLTAANTTIQNASKSSTGLRTIAARIRNTKTELDDLGEVMTEANYEELVSTLTDAGVRLTDINGEYRSTYDIMADIAAKWDEMNSMQQAAMATALSGTRQQAVFYSIIENFQEASKSMESMTNSSGALQEAFSDYMNTAKAHIQNFKNAFAALATSVFDSGLLNFFIDIATAVVNGISTVTDWIKNLGGLKTILLGVASALLLVKGGLIAYKVQMIAVAAWQKILTFFTAIKNGIMNIVNIIPNAIVAWKAYAAGTATASTALQASIPVIGLVLAALTALTAGMALASSQTNDSADDMSDKMDETNRKAKELAQTAKTETEELSKLSVVSVDRAESFRVLPDPLA